MTIHRLKQQPKLRVVESEPVSERLFGSPRFIGLTRRPELASPVRFEPTRKREGDIVL